MKQPSAYSNIWVDGAPERILTDRGTAFHNELVSELLHMCRAQHELTIA